MWGPNKVLAGVYRLTDRYGIRVLTGPSDVWLINWWCQKTFPCFLYLPMKTLCLFVKNQKPSQKYSSQSKSHQQTQLKLSTWWSWGPGSLDEFLKSEFVPNFILILGGLDRWWLSAGWGTNQFWPVYCHVACLPTVAREPCYHFSQSSSSHTNFGKPRMGEACKIRHSRLLWNVQNFNIIDTAKIVQNFQTMTPLDDLSKRGPGNDLRS